MLLRKSIFYHGSNTPHWASLVHYYNSYLNQSHLGDKTNWTIVNMPLLSSVSLLSLTRTYPLPFLFLNKETKEQFHASDVYIFWSWPTWPLLASAVLFLHLKTQVFSISWPSSNSSLKRMELYPDQNGTEHNRLRTVSYISRRPTSHTFPILKFLKNEQLMSTCLLGNQVQKRWTEEFFNMKLRSQGCSHF